MEKAEAQASILLRLTVGELSPKVRSLNQVNAASIAIYEALRQIGTSRPVAIDHGEGIEVEGW